MNGDPAEFYKSRTTNLLLENARLKRRIHLVSWARVALFIALIYSLFRVVQESTPLVFLLALYASIILFLLLMRLHQQQFQRYEFNKRLLLLLDFEQSGNGALFRDGREFQESDAVANDLDIAGPGSLFTRINRCTTHAGELELFTLLRTTPKPLTTIRELQVSVQELAQLPAFRQDLFATAYQSAMTGEPHRTFIPSQRYGTPLWKWLVLAWPVLTVGLLAAAWWWSLPWLVAIPLVSWVITARESQHLQSSYLQVSGSSRQWNAYADFFQQWNEQSFTASSLNALQHETKDAVKAFRELGTLTSWYDQRGNTLVYFFLNTLTLFEIRCARHFERWKQRHATHTARWLAALARMEALTSLGTFAYNHPQYHYPELDDTAFTLAIAGMGHPLVRMDAMVRNDFDTGHAHVAIVTGSNMSGKSTFLRAVGLNVLLAQAGLPVFASRMQLAPVRVLTSFRQQDSIQESTSYFMAELKRLKYIVDALPDYRFNLILLDEILRGTNSDDKSFGSRSLLLKLKNYPSSLTLLATHDLPLSDLETQFPETVHNYCFESTIHDNTLSFDYTIRRGVARNRNATFLMKQMGIVN